MHAAYMLRIYFVILVTLMKKLWGVGVFVRAWMTRTYRKGNVQTSNDAIGIMVYDGSVLFQPSEPIQLIIILCCAVQFMETIDRQI